MEGQLPGWKELTRLEQSRLNWLPTGCKDPSSWQRVEGWAWGPCNGSPSNPRGFVCKACWVLGISGAIWQWAMSKNTAQMSWNGKIKARPLSRWNYIIRQSSRQDLSIDGGLSRLGAKMGCGLQPKVSYQNRDNVQKGWQDRVLSLFSPSV